MPYFLVINLPAEIMPEERGERFEDPLIAALEAEDLGGIVGGGTALEDVAGKKRITSCDIEVELEELDRGLEVIREVLVRAQAPKGTTIQLMEPTEATYYLYEEDAS